MSKVSSLFWNLLGAKANKNQKNTIALVDNSHEYDEWANELSDEELKEEAQRLANSQSEGDNFAKLLAVLNVVTSRSLGLKPFDVQLQGALRIVAGDVIEMATGEGKTLSGALAAAIHALSGRQVHVISVNDYLAKRDKEWMNPLFEALGLEASYIVGSSTKEERQQAYKTQILFASVNEIGFDVLRDSLVTKPEDIVKVEPDIAIIDEADSVLVDEALVPLVLAGSTEVATPSAEIMKAVSKLKRGFHYKIDDDKRNVFLTDEGADELESALGGINLYSPAHVGTTLVQVNVALHAQVLLDRDIHYIVRDNKVQLIDSSRGRIAKLQRWPDGLQAAVELKEGLEPTDSGEVLDSITVQALVGRYKEIAGMTGTALAAGEQFRKFYNLGVSIIPPAKPNIREDDEDLVYDTKANKFAALIEFIVKKHETGQPILIGTHDVAESEELEFLLNKEGLKPVVLNAKNDAEEAEIISGAGAKNAITISTQMAGRGTDIKLGGKDVSSNEDSALYTEVVDLGGLCVIGTGRHDTQRLDSQLRGRAGRQGDPGYSIFFTSLEDPVVERNKPDTRFPNNADDTGLYAKGKANQIVDQSQKIAEGAMLQIHENTWKYNSLVNKQRDDLMNLRNKVLTTDYAITELKELVPERYEELANRESDPVSPEVLEQVAREIWLFHLDRSWSDHLAFASDIRESIHLRALGKENPLDEFHRLIVDNFKELIQEVADKTVSSFKEANITSEGIDLDNNRALRRSTSTWTYMVNENPLDSNTSNELQRMVGIFS